MIIEKFNIEIPQLNRTRTIRVHLPNNYFNDIDKKYPVLYMHDGQNLSEKTNTFNNQSWEVNETIDYLTETNIIKEVIVIGIDNEGSVRYDEYSPFKYEGNFNPQLNGRGGDGILYGKFIVETLKPYIDNHYRTLTERENTAIAGSSMGGFISLYIGSTYPDIFSKIGAFSTASWFSEEKLLEYLKNNIPSKEQYIYLDTGTKECEDKEYNYYLYGNKKIYDLLSNLFTPLCKIKFEIAKDAVHNEDAWAKRFPDFIKWIYK